MPAYRVTKKLGEGGMGVVYLAVQTSLDRQVALKLLTDACRANSQFYGRFLREVQASTRVSHRNIIKIIDYGEIEGQPYYAMEYLDAPTLEERYKAVGVLPIPLAVQACEQLCAALSAMHRAGLVHRDLKPSNVMMDDAGHVTLMDFGLVKDLERTQMTAQGKIVGTPGYLSPESILGRTMDGRADLFSLGILMFEVLCGERPFGGDSLNALLVGIVKGPHPAILAKRPDCPPWLGTFVDRLLAKNPADRFASAAAALAALKAGQGKAVAAEEGGGSVDRIVDYSGEVELEAPVPQGSIVGGLSALTALPESVGTTKPMAARRTRPARSLSRVTVTAPMAVVAPPPGVSRLTLAAGAGALIAVLAVGGWFARAPAKPEPSASATPSPAPAVSASPEPPRVRALGRALAEALDSLRPGEMVGEIHDELMRVERRVRNWYEAPPPPVLALRARWGDRLATKARDLDLAGKLGAFNWKKQEYYTSPDVPPAERLALYLKLQRLTDLVLWCRRCKIPMPVDAAPGFYEKFGQLSRSEMPAAPSVVLAFALGEHANDAAKLAVPEGGLAVPVAETERFFLEGDSRQEDVVGALENANKRRVTYVHPQALALPPLSEISHLEITGWVSDLAANNRFVVQVAEDDGAFFDVAVFRGEFGGLRPVSHSLERALFRGQRLRLGLRFEVTRNMNAWSEYANFPRLGLRYRRKP